MAMTAGTTYTGSYAGTRSRANAGDKRKTAAEHGAKRIYDPFEKTAEYVIKPKTKENKTKIEYSTRSFAEGKLEARTRTTPFASGAYGQLYERCANVRVMAYTEKYRRAEETRNAKWAAAAKSGKKNKGFFYGMKKLIGFGWLVEDREKSAEVGISAPRLSGKTVLAIIIGVALLLTIIFSLDSINSFKQEISEVDSRCEAVNDDITKLTLELDRKQDIRTVEKAAMEEFGMVDSTHTKVKYITLSEGDRVELANGATEKNTDEYAAYATALSAPVSNWGTLLDYLR